MKLSWRSLHYGLALMAGLFFLLASGTGLILAFEPWTQSRYAVSGDISNDLSYREFKGKLDEQFLDIFSLEKDAYGNIKVEGIGKEADGTFYVNATTGEPINPPKEVSGVFDLARDLHRSLFLKTPGRLLVGMASIAMVFLVFSGLALLIKRAGGIKTLFKRIPILYYARDGHASWGRILFIPVLIVSISGTYLSIDRFAELKVLSKSPILDPGDDEYVDNLPFSEIQRIVYPVLDDEPLVIEHTEGTYYFDSQTSKFQRFEPESWAKKAYRLSFVLHTAEGAPVWGLLLGLTAIGLLFLNSTGFKMILTKNRHKKHQIKADELEDMVILVGSETGHTWRFAEALEAAFQEKEIPCSLLGMDEFPQVKGQKTLLFLAATYGDGEAPENATGFISSLPSKLETTDHLRFGVLGFGSREYEAFCMYAAELRTYINRLPNTTEVVDYMTVDNRSPHDFMDWVKAFNKSTGLELHIDIAKLKPSRSKNLSDFQILDKREDRDLVLLRLSSSQIEKVISGDLLAVYPPSESIERFYSIAIDPENGDIVLLIKRTGVCSNYLGSLSIGQYLKGFIKRNPSFHRPEGPVLMISNGTGIAPFLGMYTDNDLIYWGNGYRSPLNLFEEFVKENELHAVFSREAPRGYVQDLLLQNHRLVADLLKSDGSVMICGSLSMLRGVSEVLDQISKEHGLFGMNELKRQGKVLIDCY